VEQLITYFNRLFQISDFNGDGVLQPLEFLDLLQRSGLNFPPDIILNLFIAADTNHDGVIEYDEYIMAMTAVLEGYKATHGAEFGDVVAQQETHYTHPQALELFYGNYIKGGANRGRPHGEGKATRYAWSIRRTMDGCPIVGPYSESEETSKVDARLLQHAAFKPSERRRHRVLYPGGI